MPFKRTSERVIFIALVSTLGLTAAAQAQVTPEICGPLSMKGEAGPYDYQEGLALQRNPSLAIQQGRTDKLILPDVEKFHFNKNVENLIRPIDGSFGADLQYLLKVYPNHHRGLVTLVRWSERLKSDASLPHMRYPVECYFERAIRFAKDDLIVKMLYAQYLGARKRKEEAEAQLDIVVQRSADNPITLYNAGIVFFEIKSFEKAEVAAKRAYALGHTNPHLKSQLKEQGRWTEDPAGDQQASASQPSRP